MVMQYACPKSKQDQPDLISEAREHLASLLLLTFLLQYYSFLGSTFKRLEEKSPTVITILNGSMALLVLAAIIGKKHALKI